MKKKISLIICTIMLALAFTGCSAKKAEIEYEPEQLMQTAEMIIGNFTQMNDEVFEMFKKGSDLEVNLTLMQSGLPVDKKAFVSMIDAWQAAQKECGAYLGHGDYTVEASNKEIKVFTEAQFENRDAEIEFVFDKDLNAENMTVSAKYTTSEILKKAGLNTVLGMGTVFAVLIFLSFIISLFKYIPSGDKKAQKETKEAAAPAAAPVMAAEDNVAADTELIAVIAAAIAAAEGTSTDGFVVRSIRRRTTNKWS